MTYQAVPDGRTRRWPDAQPAALSRWAWLLLLLSLSLSRSAFGLGEERHVVFTAGPGTLPLVNDGRATPLYVDAEDWPGVRRAAASFASDMQAVSGQTPKVIDTASAAGPAQDAIVVIGTLGKSRLIDELVREHKLDVTAVTGHWETSVTAVVQHPFPGVARALVLAGADKRGTIFAVYDLSEQMGVSPWTWWADVPVKQHPAIYATAKPFLQPEPQVKYRGIFLNDEAPALSGWVAEKFGGYNHVFYEHVFELLLRLKANFLWPAMWGSAFNEDDPLNPKLADEYGIVMGTSHHEPMMRAQQEWKRHGTGPWDYTANQQVLDDFWRAGVRRNRNYEELTTIGMRGDGDMAMSASTNTALLEKIVADQRKILREEVNPDVTKVPQVWALYKEVQGYYEAGMRVPDDVTLLWCDDNWGNIRRLPTPEEQKRPGGAGIYYHFDYVGDPRSYKWINTNQISKVWDQMHLAVDYHADRMWIVNVGDLKPMEFPIEFFLNYARTPERWGKDQLTEYTREWAAREFGPEHAVEIADVVDTYTRYNARRKPEQLDPNTYSLTEDHEADRIDHDWHTLVERAEKLNAELPAAYQPAFFELVLFPVKASATVGEMYIAAGRNRLYARQGRASANQFAADTRRLFAADAALADAYNHKLLDGKWDHMMDQTHIGYTFWNQPPLNTMPGVQEVQPLAGASMAVFPEGDSPESLPAFDSINRQTRTIDLANRGLKPFAYTATASAPWIHLSHSAGTVALDEAIAVTIDWSQLPAGKSIGTITVAQHNGNHEPAVTIAVEAFAPPRGDTLHGFVEDTGFVSIDAAHHMRATSADGITWQTLPGYGANGTAVEAFPATAPSSEAADRKSASSANTCLEYDFYVWSAGARTLESVLSPTLAFQPGHGLRYAVAVDGQPLTVVDAWAGRTEADWSKTVSDNAHKVLTPLGTLAEGQHTVRLCRVDPGLVLEKLVIFTGTPTSTYLGPHESAMLPEHGALRGNGRED